MQTILNNIIASMNMLYPPTPIDSHLDVDNPCTRPDGFVELGGRYHSHNCYNLGLGDNSFIYFADGDLANKDYNALKENDGKGNYYYPELKDRYGNVINDNYACYYAKVDEGIATHYRFIDKYYFEQVKFLYSFPDKRYSKARIENALMQIYACSWVYIDLPLETQCQYGLYAVRRIAYQLFPQDAKELIPVFSVILYGMLAENNKQGTLLGSSIKANGLYKMLHFDEPVASACDCQRGANYEDIMKECISYGIYHPYFDNPPDGKLYQTRYVNRIDQFVAQL